MTIAGDQGETSYESAPADVIVQIAEGVPPEHRGAIEASASTLAKRSARAAERALERSTARHELLIAMNRPLRRMIDGDADASEALAAADRRLEAYRTDLPTEEPPWPTVKLIEGKSLAADADFLADQAFGPPWHFQWQWHNGQPPVASSQDRTNGQIQMATFADQNHNWSDAHGGFGVALTTDRVQAAAGRALRRTDHTYLVQAGALGGSATVEGGVEITALEDGRLLTFARDKRFRQRLTNGEEDFLGFGGWSTGEGIEVDWIMQPGRIYTFNIGCWVFCEALGGLGSASVASARLHATVIALTADFTD